jgi:hypothetical protein
VDAFDKATCTGLFAEKLIQTASVFNAKARRLSLCVTGRIEIVNFMEISVLIVRNVVWYNMDDFQCSVLV